MADGGWAGHHRVGDWGYREANTSDGCLPSNMRVAVRHEWYEWGGRTGKMGWQ